LQLDLELAALLLFYQNCSKPICQTKVEASFSVRLKYVKYFNSDSTLIFPSSMYTFYALLAGGHKEPLPKIVVHKIWQFIDAQLAVCRSHSFFVLLVSCFLFIIKCRRLNLKFKCCKMWQRSKKSENVMLGPPTFKKGEIFEESLDFYAIQWWCHEEIWTGPSFL